MEADQSVRWKRVSTTLAKQGKELLDQPRKKTEFTKNTQADDLLNDLDRHPHVFVLGSVMNRQIKSERAWLIPYQIGQEVGSFEFQRLHSLPLDKIKKLFAEKHLHRFNETMAENFHAALENIHLNYNDCASNIWRDNPQSATVVNRFLQFRGVGTKIASLAANTLARDFKIPMADKRCIDISLDVHIKRVFARLGLTGKNATNDEVLYCAREMNPEYPGIFDQATWEIGREWCRPSNPECGNCYMERFCLKAI